MTRPSRKALRRAQPRHNQKTPPPHSQTMPHTAKDRPMFDTLRIAKEERIATSTAPSPATAGTPSELIAPSFAKRHGSKVIVGLMAVGLSASLAVNLGVLTLLDPPTSPMAVAPRNLLPQIAAPQPRAAPPVTVSAQTSQTPATPPVAFVPVPSPQTPAQVAPVAAPTPQMAAVQTSATAEAAKTSEPTPLIASAGEAKQTAQTPQPSVRAPAKTPTDLDMTDPAIRPVPPSAPKAADADKVVMPDASRRLRLPQNRPGDVVRTVQYFIGWTLVSDKRLSDGALATTVTQDVANKAGEVVMSFTFTTDIQGNPFAVLRTPKVQDGGVVTADFGSAGTGQGAPATGNDTASLTYMAITKPQLEYLKAGGLVQVAVPAAAATGATVSIGVHGDGFKAAVDSLPKVLDTRKAEKS